MSERLPSLSPSQGSFDQFRVDNTQPSSQQRRNPRDEALKKLDARIPKTEAQWQVARQRNDFETPEGIYKKVSALVQDGSLSEDLRKLIHIAVCCVDRRENEAEAYRKYRARVRAENLGELTIRNYMYLVQGLITLLDELYQDVQHRAFEALLLYAPLSLGSLTHYKQETARVKACFIRREIGPEIQASAPLHLPSIIATRHPEHSYEVVCEVFGITARREAEHRRLVAFLQNNKPVPCVLPDPTTAELSPPSSNARCRYDQIRDVWHWVTIPSLIGYKPFPIPELTQRLVAAAGKQREECVRQDIPTAVVFSFKWTLSLHSVASHQVVNDLVSQTLRI